MSDLAAKVHDLKTWPDFFEKVLHGIKTAELRENDRDFQVGDHVRLREWKPVGRIRGRGYYTGREIHVTISDVLEGWGLKKGYVMLSFNSPKLEAGERLAAAVEDQGDNSLRVEQALAEWRGK